jgi:5-methylcytosine-specific restriction endonuclease McrA
MPTLETQRAVILRDGYHCRFCGLPVIRPAIRAALRSAYPDALGWGSTNLTQHAAFQCLWLQFDHLLPNSRGGASTLENVLVTCAPCNFGRMETTLAEARLTDPLSRPTPRKWDGFDAWDGLEKLMPRDGRRTS